MMSQFLFLSPAVFKENSTFARKLFKNYLAKKTLDTGYFLKEF